MENSERLNVTKLKFREKYDKKIKDINKTVSPKRNQKNSTNVLRAEEAFKLWSTIKKINKRNWKFEKKWN